MGPTCVKWSAGHCCAAQMRMETEGNMIRTPPTRKGYERVTWHHKQYQINNCVPHCNKTKMENEIKIMIILYIYIIISSRTTSLNVQVLVG